MKWTKHSVEGSTWWDSAEYRICRLTLGGKRAYEVWIYPQTPQQKCLGIRNTAQECNEIAEGHAQSLSGATSKEVGCE